jgi:hypothetical protein
MTILQISPISPLTSLQNTLWSMIRDTIFPPPRKHSDLTIGAASTGNTQEEYKALLTLLPPILDGPPDLHMREGVLNAMRAAANGESDAEQAFLVADLSCIYQQHLRWQHCLPGVEPFYGERSDCCFPS